MERLISELGRTLAGDRLAIWDGTSTKHTPDQCEHFRKIWLAAVPHKPDPDDVHPATGFPTPLCIHRRGVVATPANAKPGTQWVQCGHDMHPLPTVEDPTGNAVCGCVGCSRLDAAGKPICPGYDHGKNIKPWDYPVTVVIPHLNTPEQIELGIALWRLQTVKPYFLVVDTGSRPAELAAVQALRGGDCEVHCLQRYTERHPSCNVSVALDLAHGLCRTAHLFHTHTDVFPRARNFLEWMIGQTDADVPVVGWRMSPRTAGPWSECVSHTATMFHNPTFRERRLSWSLDMYLDTKPAEAHLRGGWPDTESGLWWSMKREGLRPKFLGDDLNHERFTCAWFDHSRSFTCLRQWESSGGSGQQIRRAYEDMADAQREAIERLELWRKA